MKFSQNKFLLTFIILMSISVLLIGTNTVFGAPINMHEPQLPARTQIFDSDGYWEVGGKWIYDYQPPYADLINAQNNVTSFYNYLGTYGWAQRFNNGDGQVVQSDFYQWPYGTDYNSTSGIDSVDLLYFNGHGSLGNLKLQTADVSYLACEWGDTDLDWIMLDACYTLQGDEYDTTYGVKSSGRFANSLNGIRLICGAQTETNNAPPPCTGIQVAWDLIDSDGGGPDTAMAVLVSWFYGADVTNPNPYRFSIIGECWEYGSDYIWGQSTGPVNYTAPVDNNYAEWTWTCT